MSVRRFAYLAFSVLIFPRSADAGIHYLLARGVNDTNGSKSVQAPKLDAEVIGDFATGTPSDLTFVNGHALANSDTGTLLFNVAGGAKPAAGTNASTPNNWRPGARIWETLTVGKTKPTSVTVFLAFSAGGQATTPQGMNMSFSAQLKVDGSCSIAVGRKISSTLGPSPDTITNNCTTNGYSATADGAGLSISAPMLDNTIEVDAQISAENSYGGNFDGTAQLGMSGQLRVTPSGGDLVGTSPTFGTKASAGDAGTEEDASSPSQQDDAGASGSPTADAGSSAPAATDDGGCAVGTGAVAPLGAVAPFAALLWLLRRRRSLGKRSG